MAIADDDPAAAETFGYPAKPARRPAAGRRCSRARATPRYLGIYTHPDDGREEMVMTVASNQFQNHNQLLRHGMLNWVTRGVFLGYQRNYLELQVDDLFLGDDAWDPATNTTSYDPARASRMTPADVDRAIAWSRARGLRLDMAFNGGGSAPAGRADGRRPARGQVRRPGRARRVRLRQPHLRPPEPRLLDRLVHRRGRSPTTWPGRGDHGLPLASAAEVVTGEHSGLANARPGNPGTIDPPAFDDVEPAGHRRRRRRPAPTTTR